MQSQPLGQARQAMAGIRTLEIDGIVLLYPLLKARNVCTITNAILPVSDQ
jgi:hypothetical protein